jgi:Uma2 family endonuclease
VSDVQAPPVWRATVDDLYEVDGKAELVDGELRIMDGTGDMPAVAGGIIFASLLVYRRRTRRGAAYPDNATFLVELPNRRSFSPDAAYYTGPRAGMKFLPAPPDFAVEVRSESDYRPASDWEMLRKRRDYFAADTLVVWDVDLLSEDVVRVFRDGDAETPAAIYRRGEMAEAEPAVPGWRFPVDELFE